MDLAHVVRTFWLSFFAFFGRRQHARAPTALFVDWHAFGSGVHHRSRTEDVSRGGALLSCLDPLPLGSPLIVVLATGLRRIELRANVVWASSAQMGISFDPAFASVAG
jgi:hypothetical protein